MVLKMFIKAESMEGKRCPQLLLTFSPKLCLAIKDHFVKLRQSWKSRVKSSQRVTLVDEDVGDAFADTEDVPMFQELKDDDFPLFWTFGYLLRVLDKSIPGEKFWGFKRNPSKYSMPCEIEWERFQTHYMRRMPFQAQKRFVGGSVHLENSKPSSRGRCRQ